MQNPELRRAEAARTSEAFAAARGMPVKLRRQACLWACSKGLSTDAEEVEQRPGGYFDQSADPHHWSWPLPITYKLVCQGTTNA